MLIFFMGKSLDKKKLDKCIQIRMLIKSQKKMQNRNQGASRESTRQPYINGHLTLERNNEIIEITYEMSKWQTNEKKFRNYANCIASIQ